MNYCKVPERVYARLELQEPYDLPNRSRQEFISAYNRLITIKGKKRIVNITEVQVTHSDKTTSWYRFYDFLNLVYRHD